MESGDNLWAKRFDAFVAAAHSGSLIKKDPQGTCLGRAGMKLIDWRPTMIRWLALGFSLGAWAGIVLVMLKLLA